MKKNNAVVGLLGLVPTAAIALMNMSCFGVQFYSDSLDYLNMALDVFRGVPAPWFPFHRTIGYPALIALCHFIAPRHVIGFVVALQICSATLLSGWLIWLLRERLSIVPFAMLCALVPSLAFKYVMWFMTDVWMIALGIAAISIFILLVSPETTSRRKSAALLMLIFLIVFGVTIRPSFAVVGWVALAILGATRSIAARAALGGAAAISLLIFSAALLDRHGYAPARFNPPIERPNDLQSGPALYQAFVRDVSERLRTGLHPRTFAEMVANARELTSEEKSKGKCSVLPCVGGSPRLAMFIDSVLRHPELLIMGPVPGSSIGASFQWLMQGPVWHYRGATPPNSMADVAPNHGSSAVKFLAAALSNYLADHPADRSTNPWIARALRSCSYGAEGLCLLAQKDINTRWWIWSSMENQYGSEGADIVMRAAASNAAEGLSTERLALFLHQLSSAAFGFPTLNFDNGYLEASPAPISHLVYPEWLPSYLAPDIAHQIRSLHVDNESTRNLRRLQDLEAFVANFIRPVLGVVAMLLFIPTLICGNRSERSVVIFCLGVYAAGLLSISYSLTAYERYLDHFLMFLFVATGFQMSIAGRYLLSRLSFDKSRPDKDRQELRHG